MRDRHPLGLAGQSGHLIHQNLDVQLGASFNIFRSKRIHLVGQLQAAGGILEQVSDVLDRGVRAVLLGAAINHRRHAGRLTIGSGAGRRGERRVARLSADKQFIGVQVIVVSGTASADVTAAAEKHQRQCDNQNDHGNRRRHALVLLKPFAHVRTLSHCGKHLIGWPAAWASVTSLYSHAAILMPRCHTGKITARHLSIPRRYQVGRINKGNRPTGVCSKPRVKDSGNQAAPLRPPSGSSAPSPT